MENKAERYATAAAPREVVTDASDDWYCSNLTIQDRDSGQLVAYKANPVQLRIRAAVNRQLAERGYVRIIVCKARQVGASTEIEAHGFRMSLLNPNVEGIIVAHEAKAADDVFRRTKTFEERCPLKRPLKFQGRKELQWDSPHRSALRLAVCGKGMGRGGTRHYGHLSELAHWDESYAARGLLGVLGSIHRVEGTYIAIESTANGTAGEFYDRWKSASRGESEYEPLFFSWLDDKGYELPGQTPDDPAFARFPREWREDEPALRAAGATDGNLAWRLRMIADECGSSVDRFRQEFPSTPEEAFVGSGRPVFPRSICEPMRLRLEKRERLTPTKRYSFLENGKVQEDRNGFLKIFEMPDACEEYMLTGDVASGRAVDTEHQDGRKKGDFSTAGITNRRSGREVAVWHGRIEADRFGSHVIDPLGRLYNDAMAVIEANGTWGIIALQKLFQTRYPNIYRRKKHDAATQRPPDQSEKAHHLEYGWWSDRGTKIIAIADLNAAIRDEWFYTPELEAWMEMITFETKDDGKMGARNGCYDDRVMRCAIAATMLRTTPLPEEKRVAPPAPNTFAYIALVAKQREEGHQPASTGWHL